MQQDEICASSDQLNKLPPEIDRQQVLQNTADDHWQTDFYWTLLQPKGWIAKYNMYTKIENTNKRKYNTINMHNVTMPIKK